MNPLLVLVRAHYMRLWRSKAPLAIALMGPLLIVLLAGLSFDTAAPLGLRVGVVVPAVSDLSNQVISALRDNRMTVQDFIAEAACSQSVQTGENHACLLFSSPFGLSESNNTVTILIDGSNLALAGIITEGLQQPLEGQSIAISTNITREMLSALAHARQQAAEGKAVIVKLTTTQDSALRILAASKQSAQALAAPVAVTDISVDAVRAATLTLRDTTGTTLKQSIPLLRNTLFVISNASAQVNASNATSAERDAINARLANVSSQVNAALNSAIALNTTLNSSDVDINASLIIIGDQLAQAKTQLAATATKSGSIIQEFGTLEAQLNEALVSITSLQRVLDTIESSTSVRVTDPSRISQPIRPVVQPLAGRSRLATIYPVLLVIVVTFGGLLIAPSIVHMERHAGAQLRLSLSPASSDIVAIATLLTGLGIVAAQAFIVVALSALLFPGTIAAPISTFVVLVLVGALFVTLGAALSHVINTEESALLATLMVGVLLLALSGIIIPTPWMPSLVGALAAYNPLLLAAGIIRQTAVFGTSFYAAAGFVTLLIATLVVLAVGAIALAVRRGVTLDDIMQWQKRK